MIFQVLNTCSHLENGSEVSASKGDWPFGWERVMLSRDESLGCIWIIRHPYHHLGLVLRGIEREERGEERRKTGMGGKWGAPQDGRGEAYLLLRRLTRPQPLTPSRGNKILPLKAHLVSSHPRSARYWAPPPLTSSPESQPSLADVVLQARKPHGHVQLPENHTCDSENSWRMWLCENLAKVQVRGAESMQCYSALK